MYPDPLMNFHGMGGYERAFFSFASLHEPADGILTALDPKDPEIVLEDPS